MVPQPLTHNFTIDGPEFIDLATPLISPSGEPRRQTSSCFSPERSHSLSPPRSLSPVIAGVLAVQWRKQDANAMVDAATIHFMTAQWRKHDVDPDLDDDGAMRVLTSQWRQQDTSEVDPKGETSVEQSIKGDACAESTISSTHEARTRRGGDSPSSAWSVSPAPAKRCCEEGGTRQALQAKPLAPPFGWWCQSAPVQEQVSGIKALLLNNPLSSDALAHDLQEHRRKRRLSRGRSGNASTPSLATGGSVNTVAGNSAASGGGRGRGLSRSVSRSKGAFGGASSSTAVPGQRECPPSGLVSNETPRRHGAAEEVILESRSASIIASDCADPNQHGNVPATFSRANIRTDTPPALRPYDLRYQRALMKRLWPKPSGDEAFCDSIGKSGCSSSAPSAAGTRLSSPRQQRGEPSEGRSASASRHATPRRANSRPPAAQPRSPMRNLFLTPGPLPAGLFIPVKSTLRDQRSFSRT